MTQGIHELTDKEKEALRLLVEGHDAKSSASKLGISVYTINDRLRNARRKLQVSSSREAARILRDAEEATPQSAPQSTPQSPPNAPQNDAHTEFGIAGEGAPPDTTDLDQHSQKGSSKLIWLAGGMLIMSLLIAAAIFAAVSTSGEVAPSASSSAPAASETSGTRSTSPSDAQSYAKAQAFLAKIDTGDWAGSWNVAGDFIQSQVPVDGWSATVQPVREPLGAVTSRTLKSVEQTKQLPGAPEGDYEVLQFTTTFEADDKVLTETLIMIRTEDGFDVAGFFIR